ncbi:MAG TPA: hypothetical protein VHZ97_27850 [Pseudonocardiaceae bacterium]|nr:hypothetical protein [Pseudonocardiaceae bacterium]
MTRLQYQVNAIGYAAQQNLVYGIASGGDGALVRISTQGSLSDLGQVRGAGDRLSDAVAGAVLGGDLYVRSDGELIAIGVDPSSGDFDAVAKVVPLRPEWLADEVDDFAVDPANGLLYGIRGDAGGSAAVVSIDPGSGAVAQVRTVQGLPGWADYGSVVLSGQTMYAIADDVFGQSRLYRIPLEGSGAAIQLGDWSAADVTDLAGCLATPISPTTPPPPPPATTPKPPPPPPATTTPKPVPAQVIPPTTTIAPTTTALPPPLPTAPPPLLPAPTSPPAVLPQAQLLAKASDQERNTERRWALTTVVIIFGGGAVAARRSSARARKPR